MSEELDIYKSKGFVLMPNGEYAKVNKNENIANRTQRIHPNNQEPTQGNALVSSPQREEARWYGTARFFEIRFVIYAVRPADWDGYDIKELQDWLVTAGILPNDGWRYLFGGCRSKKVSKETEEKTVIEINAIEHE